MKKTVTVDLEEGQALAIIEKDGKLPEGVGLCMDCTDSDKMLKAGYTHPIVRLIDGKDTTMP